MAEGSIDLRSLKLLVDAALDRLISEGGSNELVVNPERNLYWDLPPRTLFDTSKRPGEFDVGSVLDDAGFVSVAAASPGPTAIYSLVHAAPILRYIAEEFSHSDQIGRTRK
jgi:hypothetical protein